MPLVRIRSGAISDGRPYHDLTGQSGQKSNPRMDILHLRKPILYLSSSYLMSKILFYNNLGIDLTRL